MKAYSYLWSDRLCRKVAKQLGFSNKEISDGLETNDLGFTVEENMLHVWFCEESCDLEVRVEDFGEPFMLLGVEFHPKRLSVDAKDTIEKAWG